MGKTLLQVRELGGYPDFTGLYRELGLRLLSAQGMRKGLAVLKRETPDLIIAEFNYAPTYGSRISTVEALLAGLQRCSQPHRVLLFCEKPHLPHLALLEPQYGHLPRLTYPIDRAALRAWLEADSA
ncbi:MAG: hypothetical protein HQL47_02100 [Gammaproteobacteria bacterium]|nr:hypothetical protein [Gammaproteobacteria bacterium]